MLQIRLQLIDGLHTHTGAGAEIKLFEHIGEIDLFTYIGEIDLFIYTSHGAKVLVEN